MDYDTYIDKIKYNNEIKMLQFMKEDCQSENDLKLINDLITYKYHKNNPVKQDKIIKSNYKEKISKIDKYLYNKPWKKLEQIHKKNKLIEYCDNHLFNAPEDNLIEIKNQLIEEFNDNKLNSAKKIIYDPISSNILEIKGLEYDTNTNTYSYF